MLDFPVILQKACSVMPATGGNLGAYLPDRLNSLIVFHFFPPNSSRGSVKSSSFQLAKPLYLNSLLNLRLPPPRLLRGEGWGGGRSNYVSIPEQLMLKPLASSPLPLPPPTLTRGGELFISEILSYTYSS